MIAEVYKGEIDVKYYRDASGAIRRAVETESGLIDAETGRHVPDGIEELWTIHDAAVEWAVNEKYARLIVGRVPGAQRHITGPQAIWLIPAGSPNPTGGRPGRKPKTVR